MSLNSWFEFLKKKKRPTSVWAETQPAHHPSPLSLFFFHYFPLGRPAPPRRPARPGHLLLFSVPLPAWARTSAAAAPFPPSSSRAVRCFTAPLAYGRQHDAAPPSRVNQQHSAARPPPSLCATSNLPHPLCSGGIRQRRVVFLPRRPGQGRALDERIKAGRAPARARGARRPSSRHCSLALSLSVGVSRVNTRFTLSPLPHPVKHTSSMAPPLLLSLLHSKPAAAGSHLPSSSVLSPVASSSPTPPSPSVPFPRQAAAISPPSLFLLPH